MKGLKTSSSLAAAFAATGAVAGALAPRASSLPAVTIKGNGASTTVAGRDTLADFRWQRSSLETKGSTFEGLITNPVRLFPRSVRR